ncbi:MAG: carbon storage regulator CsrA [Planctomycetes bacterium]|nr:carbon storage regulator CsrA [Planctomycetota bacterium]
MLVLSRRQGESIVIGGTVRVTVVTVSGGQVKLSIDAPKSVSIHRSEVWEAIRQENAEAATGAAEGLPAPAADGGTLSVLPGKTPLDKLVSGKPDIPPENGADKESSNNSSLP